MTLSKFDFHCCRSFVCYYKNLVAGHGDHQYLILQSSSICGDLLYLKLKKENTELYRLLILQGTSTKYSPQRVGLTHIMEHEDVIQIVKK